MKFLVIAMIVYSCSFTNKQVVDANDVNSDLQQCDGKSCKICKSITNTLDKASCLKMCNK